MGGDDTFDITPQMAGAVGLAITVEGDEPGASDTLIYRGVTDDIVVDLDADPAGATLVQQIVAPVVGGPGPVTPSGIDSLVMPLLENAHAPIPVVVCGRVISVSEVQ